MPRARTRAQRVGIRFQCVQRVRDILHRADDGAAIPREGLVESGLRGPLLVHRGQGPATIGGPAKVQTGINGSTFKSKR